VLLFGWWLSHRDPLAWPRDCERAGRECWATPSDERGVRCVYVVDSASASVCHMEQHCEADVAALMESALALRHPPARGDADGDHPAAAAASTDTSSGAYRVYMVLDEVQPCAPAEIDALFSVPSFASPAGRPRATPAGNDKHPAGGECVGGREGAASPTQLLSRGEDALDVDDDVAVPFDTFWAEFL
jgi:hypothetical protein